MRNVRFITFICVFSTSLLYGGLQVGKDILVASRSGEKDSTGYKKIQYGGMHQFGLVFGDKRKSTCFNFVNGIRFSRFFTGIGVDAQLNQPLNNYYYYNYYGDNVNNTSAIYADLRYYINKKKNFFAVTNAGANFIIEDMGSSGNYNYKKSAGYYTAFGLGFKARLGKEVFYSFDLSYSIRQTRFNYNYINFLNEWQTDKYDIRQYSILLRMGFEIF